MHALADLLTLRDALAPSTLVHLIELSTAEEALGPSPPEVAFQALLAQPLGTKIGLMGWRSRVLPLLWIAVEVGYTDDGSGDNDRPDLSRQFVGHAAVASDAWQRDLGASFQKFEGITVVTRCAGRLANKDDWITWLYSHAVLPVTLHQPPLRSLFTPDAARADLCRRCLGG